MADKLLGNGLRVPRLVQERGRRAAQGMERCNKRHDRRGFSDICFLEVLMQGSLNVTTQGLSAAMLCTRGIYQIQFLANRQFPDRSKIASIGQIRCKTSQIHFGKYVVSITLYFPS